MLAATAVLENGWKPNMTEEAAKKLCRDAIAAGIINDMGSGSNVDLAIIKPNDHCEVRVNSISHFWISCILLIPLIIQEGLFQLLFLDSPTIRYSSTIW